MLQLIYELRKNWRRTGGRDGWKSKVLQEVLADLKMAQRLVDQVGREIVDDMEKEVVDIDMDTKMKCFSL